MPKFYFDIRINGNALHDDIGLEVNALSDARAQAIEALGEVVKDHHKRSWDASSITVGVRDESGTTLILAQAVLTVHESSAGTE
ncbi:hypothetical protein SAMN06295905_2205 [Devosia lucknowensis]|uniref:DUF6894 domain-containing protein n=1 Tax=Devosia lucknowensis TaxID=1096929 RepID=A0A1Y6FDX6_9HYPH|nr:hypothetical protein [Devosia lucknowensis]SMQ72977.1 hypothetical protein SAMN06295905_2205 [Devosia lucknowensis]